MAVCITSTPPPLALYALRKTIWLTNNPYLNSLMGLWCQGKNSRDARAYAGVIPIHMDFSYFPPPYRGWDANQYDPSLNPLPVNLATKHMIYIVYGQ